MFRSTIRIIAILYENVELSIFYALLFVLFFRSKLSDYRLPIGWTLTSVGSCNACLPSRCCQHRISRHSPPSVREPSRLERKPRPSWSISSGCGSARVVDKRRGSPHNGCSTSRPFGRTTTPRDGTGAWTHELVTRPSTSTASWSCCITTVDSPGVALEWWPHSTPPTPRLRRQAQRSMGALLQWWAWRDAAAETLPEDAMPSGVMAALVANLCQGSTEMERQSCWQHCDHWLHLSLSQWPAQVQAVTTKW